jgi:hypothetical protein
MGYYTIWLASVKDFLGPVLGIGNERAESGADEIMSESETPHHAAGSNCQRDSNKHRNDRDALTAILLRPNSCANKN